MKTRTTPMPFIQQLARTMVDSGILTVSLISIMGILKSPDDLEFERVVFAALLLIIIRKLP